MEGAGGRRGFVPCRFAQVKLLQQQLEGPGDRKRTGSLQVLLLCRLCRSLTPVWGKDEAHGWYVTALASETRLPFWGQTPGLRESSPSLPDISSQPLSQPSRGLWDPPVTHPAPSPAISGTLTGTAQDSTTGWGSRLAQWPDSGQPLLMLLHLPAASMLHESPHPPPGRGDFCLRTSWR